MWNPFTNKVKYTLPPLLINTKMDYQPKRTFQLEDFDKLADPSGHPTKKRKSAEGDEEEADTSSVHDEVEQSSTKEKKQSAEMRLEVNRQRAREIRKRKKIMIENMQNQLVLLTLENNKLRMENQNQQQELAVLRKTSQLLTSNHGVSLSLLLVFHMFHRSIIVEMSYTQTYSLNA